MVEGAEWALGVGTFPGRARSVPAQRTWLQSHFTQSMRRSPRMGNQDVQCVPSKGAMHLLWRIHFCARVGVGPPRTAVSSGRMGSHSGTSSCVAILASKATSPLSGCTCTLVPYGVHVHLHIYDTIKSIQHKRDKREKENMTGENGSPCPIPATGRNQTSRTTPLQRRIGRGLGVYKVLQG